MKVWIVSSGEYMEGSSILGIYKTPQSAINAAAAAAKSGRLRYQYRHDEEVVWQDKPGMRFCSFITVKPWTVEP